VVKPGARLEEGGGVRGAMPAARLVCASCGEREASYVVVALWEGELFTPLCEACFSQARETVGALMGEAAFRHVRLDDLGFLRRLVELGNEEYRWRVQAHEKCLEELGRLRRRAEEEGEER
jgi:hypothetical protein